MSLSRPLIGSSRSNGEHVRHGSGRPVAAAQPIIMPQQARLRGRSRFIRRQDPRTATLARPDGFSIHAPFAAAMMIGCVLLRTCRFTRTDEIFGKYRYS